MIPAFLLDIGFGRDSVYLLSLAMSNNPSNQTPNPNNQDTGYKEAGNVLSKSPRKSLLTRQFLRPDKRVDGDGDSAVDVLCGTVFGETHFAEGFCGADYGFEVADLYVVSICTSLPEAR